MNGEVIVELCVQIDILVPLHLLCGLFSHNGSVSLHLPYEARNVPDSKTSFLPETLRLIVGNGSILPPRLLRPLVPVVGSRASESSPASNTGKRLGNPLRLLTYPDITILLFFNGIIYSVFYGVTASISTLFHEAYPSLSETDIGLCFLGGHS